MLSNTQYTWFAIWTFKTRDMFTGKYVRCSVVHLYVSGVNELCWKLSNVMSDRISDVVDAYEHALCGRFPRARYVVGYDANILIPIFEKLPEWAGDWLMAKLTGEDRIPAVLKT